MDESKKINKQVTYAEVIEKTEVGEGARVCIDVIDSLHPQEGAFVGNTGHGYVFVLSENRQTETYPARPFRINCGSLHQYVYLDNDKTCYLSEVKPGMFIPIFSSQDKRSVSIGRIKMEKRNFVRLVCRTESGTVSATLQHSDSVHVYCQNKGPVSIVDIQPRDKVRWLLDEPGRHLGQRKEEYIVEE